MDKNRMLMELYVKNIKLGRKQLKDVPKNIYDSVKNELDNNK